MKKLRWPLIGIGTAATVGLASYLIYRKLRPSKSPPRKRGESSKKKEGSKPKVDITEALALCLLESMPVYMSFAKQGRKISAKPKETTLKLTQNLRKERKSRLTVVDGAVQQVEREVCRRTGWDIHEYYEEIARRHNSNDP